MQYFKAIITNDFINASKQKRFESKFFVVRYNPTNQNPETEFKFIFDREDNRRVVLKLSEEEMKSLFQSLQSLLNQ